MKKNLLTACVVIAIALLGAYLGKDRGSQNNQETVIQFAPFLLLYYFVKKEFRAKLSENSSYEVRFPEAFKIGFQICTISAFMASVFYYLIPDDVQIQYSASKLIRALDVFLGPMIIGTIASVISALILPRIEITTEVATVSKRWIKTYAIILGAVIILAILIIVLRGKH